MATIGVEYWACPKCAYKVMTRDQSGKPFKKEPKTCPSCGHKPEPKGAPVPAKKD